jgi:hypothetical protein
MRALPSRSSLAWSMSLAALLVAGLMTTIWFAFALFDIVSSVWEVRDTTSEQIVFTIQGEPLISTHLPGNPSAIFRTLDSKPVEKPAVVRLSTANPQEIPPADPDPRTFPVWNFRILGFLQPPPTVNYWYLVQEGPPTNLAYFVGYEPQTKQIIGYMGRKGYCATLPPADEKFVIPGSMFSGCYAPSIGKFNREPYGYEEDRRLLFLVADGVLHKVDFGRQSVETVSMPDKVVSVGQYEQLTAVADDRHATYEWRIVVRLPQALHILTTEGEPIRTLPLDKVVQDQILALRGTTTDEMILQASPADDHYAPNELYWLGPNGKVLRHRQATWSRLDPPAPPSASSRWMAVAMIPLPLPLTVIPLISAIAFTWNGTEPSSFTELADLFAEFWLPYVVLLVVSLLLAIYAYRHQRSYDPRSARAWAMFVFLLGPAGLLGYLLHRQWPARSACSQCGKWVPRDRATCLACREEFSVPAMKGIEVFA